MSDDERGKKRKVPPSPRYLVRAAPSPAQRLHAAARARAESRRKALLALGISDAEGVEDVMSWPLDRPRRKRARKERAKVERGGWAPEGSFEFECWSLAADALRTRKSALARLVKRVTTLSASQAQAVVSPTRAPSPASASAASGAAEQPAKKEARRAAGEERAEEKAEEGEGAKKKGGGKKKKKKKKKATLANEGNPHHIDKYRPSRLPSYSWHSSVLFPPSLPFLSVLNRNPIRENEYICFKCEVALYYASDGARRKALRARFRQLARFDPRLRRRRRKGRCTRRRGEGAGGGEGADGEEEFDDEDGDEEYDDDEGYDGEEDEDGEDWARRERERHGCTCCLEPP